MVKKKSKQLNNQIDNGTNKPFHGSIKKYCTEKNNFKQYEDNLHLYNKNKVHIKETTAVINNEDGKHLSNGDKNISKKNYRSNEKKKKGSHKPYDLIPRLNIEQYSNNKKANNKTKSVEIFSKECNFDDETYLNSFTQRNETQTNEYLVKDYQVTHSTIKDLSISVKRFYKNIPSATNDVDRINKDMPLISDTTFNSKTDFNQSPMSSKLNSSHKISLNLKCISNTNDKQQKVTAFFPIRRSSRKTKNIVNEEKQLALEKAIASQNEDGLKITMFPNKGRGIIAGRDFTRGEYVVEYAGELVNLEEARRRESIYSKDTSTGCYMYYFKYGSIHYCIDATTESSRLGRLVNHSRFGNLGPKVIEILGLPRIVLIAKSDIKEGEELTYDYGDRSKKSLIYHPWLAY
ncbi:histone-lysine N-methyltransferase PR-Set7 isoform X2 [Sipha flava]|uniref:[histone H4]-lysine(20) N-methyltransferase n=1 Tax=Sipha flava TaxID=143950 RepID=A0A8B8FJQ6_9HEMI|nr:histone-lysine N-methyltransferase PR-Set7 isoform X2 [Sipha flava]